MPFGIEPFCLDRLVFGIRNELIFLHLLSVMRTLLIGPNPLVSWLNEFPFWAHSIGLLVVWILGLVVFLTWNCSFFMSFGLARGCLLRKLNLAIVGQGVQFQCRLFRLVQALIFGALVVSLLRSLCYLPGGRHRFLPCSIGANHCRLRHIGWERCGHGLTSRPRESASEPFLNELLGLFRYPAGSGRALLAGTLPLRYCAARFACRTTTWRLPVPGHVVDLVAAHVGAVREAIVDGAGQEVHWVSGSGPGRKLIRLNRKPPAHLAGLVVQSRPRVWKRLRSRGTFQCFHS